MKQTANPG